jgi:hypothetical protein
MNPGVQTVICGGRRRQVTLTFTANGTWTAPFTTSRIDTATGKGAAGSTTTTTTNGWYSIATTTYHRRDGGTDQTASQSAGVFDGSPMPSNYCDPTVYYTVEQSTVYTDSTKCYSFFATSKTDTTTTTGASTTAFGKTFPGGAGGPATITTFSNVIVTPGASYNIVVPAGGSLTITYFQ